MTIAYKRNKQRRRLLDKYARGVVTQNSNPKLQPDHGTPCNVVGCDAVPTMPLTGQCEPHSFQNIEARNLKHGNKPWPAQ